MSAAQAGSRRLSTRLQEKESAHGKSNGASHGGEGKKRKNDYDEEDDGFAFSRVSKAKRPRKSKQNSIAEPIASSEAAVRAPVTRNVQAQQEVAESRALPEDETHPDAPQKKRRKKLSFSTPKGKEQQPVRRSKRLSSEAAQPGGSPTSVSIPAGGLKLLKNRKPQAVNANAGIVKEKHSSHTKNEEKTEPQTTEEATESTHSATKIALPFADTPVIRRNKAMREGKNTKGDRRSSLGLRGRRASSLIDAGNSHALPHQEVEVVDFYKHIESDLLEPRRMRQLLTWCATRSMHAKPKGTDFEDASAKSAARVIEEELLKEISNKSELSDWFSREDAPENPKPLPERPNPKNVQNTQKMYELEQQIQRLKAERDSLQNLLHSPKILESEGPDDRGTTVADIDRELLSSEDAALLDALGSSENLARDVSRRVNEMGSSLGPTIDRFADGIHKVAQYRTAIDRVAGKVLAICADKLDSREKAGRRKALDTEDDRSPGRDLSNVLRGISKADR